MLDVRCTQREIKSMLVDFSLTIFLVTGNQQFVLFRWRTIWVILHQCDNRGCSDLCQSAISQHLSIMKRNRFWDSSEILTIFHAHVHFRFCFLASLKCILFVALMTAHVYVTGTLALTRISLSLSHTHFLLFYIFSHYLMQMKIICRWPHFLQFKLIKPLAVYRDFSCLSCVRFLTPFRHWTNSSQLEFPRMWIITIHKEYAKYNKAIRW